MNKWHKKIVDYMMMHPGQYIKLDDIAISLLVPTSSKWSTFKRAYDDLIISGRVEICGNSIRINQ